MIIYKINIEIYNSLTQILLKKYSAEMLHREDPPTPGPRRIVMKIAFVHCNYIVAEFHYMGRYSQVSTLQDAQ